MAKFNARTIISLLAAAVIVTLGITAYGDEAMSLTSGAKDPTALTLFDKVSVGGRQGCEVQSWPDIAPECLLPGDGSDVSAKPVRRI
ncbi:hypothetical protein [Kaistia terrae]|jgi:hypothetical protein|uniref:Uncharacterized protein n=1 Tax=Kaistia terrae TaxID=537017 RepID=A0ABW0PZM3_9HYPH|nr:hypothetical protein [Kaistia terrae]MCX5580342.1 hypothetical protein [Kaistia terrae]